MKRKIALLMACVLLVGTSFSTYATEPGTAAQTQQGGEASPDGVATDGETGAGDGSETTTPQQPGENSLEDGNQAGGDQPGATTEGTGQQGTETPSDSTPSIGNNGDTVPEGTVQPDTEQPSQETDAPPEGTQPAETTGSQETATPDEEGKMETGTARAPVKMGDIGQVDVSIGAALILGAPVVFAVTLTDAQGGIQERFLTLGEDNGSGQEERCSFTGLAEGEYDLTVTGESFATYTQKVNVAGRETVKLMTGFLKGKDVEYVEGKAHPGVLLIGDVNKDGIINEGDRAALMAAIEGGDATGLVADLNRDGQIDLVDLEYFTIGYNQSKDILARIQRSIPSAAIDSSGYGDTRVEGDLAQLLENGASVTLKPGVEAPISRENSVGLIFEFNTGLLGDGGVVDGLVFQSGKDTPITDAEVDIAYLDENGQEQHTGFVSAEPMGPLQLTVETNVEVSLDEKGNIEVRLGGQIAVKRVTLNIKGVRSSNNLVEIAKVEFVNGMEDRIPEPEPGMPTGLVVNPGSKRISVSWQDPGNATGYEVEVMPVGTDAPETLMVPKCALDITSYGGNELVNGQTYQVRVRSANGTWRSIYTESVTATPMPTRKPDKPDNVSAVGKYQSILVSWKLMKDTDSYNLYYRKSSDSEYLKIEGITTNSYTITGLEDMTEYTVYVTGVNMFGESGPSLLAAATTTDLKPAQMPKYKLINPVEDGKPSSHIVSTAQSSRMEASPLDVSAATAWGTVDQNGASYYIKSSWDDGGYNYMNLKHGLTYEFDQAYKLDTIAFHDVTSQDTGISYAQVRWWDETGKEEYITYGRISLQKKRDSGNRLYYVLKLPQPVNAKKIQFGLARYAAEGNQITVSEVYFYHYDTLLEDIMNLYEDNLHTVLREDVTQETIDALRAQVNTPDTVSGELHPDRELLERELQTAEAILHDQGLKASVQVHSGISTKDVGRGFGGLNAWQPLGVASAAGEEIMVYVGHNSKKTGEAANLQLVATQYHSEAGPVSTVAANLKVGANKVTVPKLGSLSGVEGGGALYVQYTGNDGNDLYAVRVSGGAQVPRLDLYQMTDSAERLARATAYVEELDAFVAQMETLHGEVHQNSGNSQVVYPYDQANCILGASDILLDTMMLSLPAKQILGGLGEGSASERAQKLLQSMQAMEDMMYLFYQHKGLNANAADAKDRIPKGHLNIRYQRMFSGAFMYASGNHIGIEWGSAPGMMTAVPVVSDSQGRYQSGNYFGWGIAHEIGHCINQGDYAIAEITNNYFSVLAQAKDNNSSVRFQYPEVYKKVTSGTKGRATNVFTQLGMYWQLHLAYDRGYNYKTYENPQEQLASLFFARVDTYARNTAKAPSPGGVTLKLEGDRDQTLMRLACAAAERNILEFFERWGMTPDEGTRAYAAQFAKEARAIYYVSDESRSYSLRGGSSSLGTDGKMEAVGDGVTAVVNANVKNQVDITLGSKGIPEGDVLGYEITRCMIEGGRTVKQPVGFATENTFTDTVYINNRVVWYEVTVIDKYLNRSAVKTLSTVKIEHDGHLDKSFWTVSTQNLTATNVPPVGEGTDSDPCEPKPEDMAMRLIDGKSDTAYTATINGNAEIVIAFNQTLTVSGFQQKPAAGMTGGYRVQALEDGIWLEVGKGTFEGDTTVHFRNDKGDYVCTYRATALRLIPDSTEGQISIAELEVIGPTSDNVDIKATQEGIPAIGRLSADYRYGNAEEDVIPAGSIVFTGSFKGNPAYNVVLLYDQDGNNVGGVDTEGNVKAQSIILADVPAEGFIPNVRKGTWIYWIPAGQVDLTKIVSVRAELYRVNDAVTNEGQRLVSDSLFMEMPKELPDISFSSDNAAQQ